MAKVNIVDYQATFIPLYDKSDHLQLAIRMYFVNGDMYFLCVDPYTLQTKILLSKQSKFRGSKASNPGYFSMQLLENAPYIKLLSQFSTPPYVLQNYGLIKTRGDLSGTFLTVDLCPSTKKFEKRLFLALIKIADKLHKPCPVALSISGLWLLQHQQEFAWLLEQFNNHKLDITWVNHSFSHPYYPDLPLNKNFLLTNTEYFVQEVLMTEKLLLEYGQLPSIYFRFPGLVANKELVLSLKKMSLIALGCDAWLAKGQYPQNGSIILIHGNGNEPDGIDKFLALLRNDNLRFLSLNKGVASIVTAADLPSQ